MEAPLRRRPGSRSSWAVGWLLQKWGGGPTFVLQCVEDFIPLGRKQHNISHSLTAKCYTTGTHSRCLSEWWHPTWIFVRFFHHIKIIYVARGPKKDEKREEITFFHGKEITPLEPESVEVGWGLLFPQSLNLGENQSSIGFRARPRWLTNGKGTFLQTTSFTSLKCGIWHAMVKKPCSCGLFGIKQLQSMKGGHVLDRLPSLNNVWFASLTQVK